MNILHLAAHMGGGVGKAHAALCAAETGTISRSYVLFDRPQETRYIDQIAEHGARFFIQPDKRKLLELIEAADICQVEWWSHPQLYAGLCGHPRPLPLPAMRLQLWCHISGLEAPFFPAALVEAADQVALTSAVSLNAPGIRQKRADNPQQVSVANSAFGFSALPRSLTAAPLSFGYLGTIDFIKMSPHFFDWIDAVDDAQFQVSLFGHCPENSAPSRAAMRMHHQASVRFEGFTTDPQKALGNMDVMVYLLASGHYGTAENALIEAMSCGVVPICCDNPAERQIIRHGKTGFLVRSRQEFVDLIGWMRAHPEDVRHIGRTAAETIARTHSVSNAALEWRERYEKLMQSPKRCLDFASLLGPTPSDWFSNACFRNGRNETWPQALIDPDQTSKGSLAHFLSCFPKDRGLQALRLQTQHMAQQQAAAG